MGARGRAPDFEEAPGPLSSSLLPRRAGSRRALPGPVPRGARSFRLFDFKSRRFPVPRVLTPGSDLSTGSPAKEDALSRHSGGRVSAELPKLATRGEAEC